MIGFPFDSQVTYERDGTPVFDRAISSAPLRQLIKKMLTNGVLPNPSTNLQVQPGTGMNVIVNPGFAVIEGGLKYEETQRTLAVQASDTTYDRIDTVVMRWNDNANARSCDLYVIQGVPALSPVRPALNRESSVYEIGLADIFIAANTSAISAARITDTRYESARCGIISSISEFDSDSIYNQIQEDLAGFKEEEQVQFLEWFDVIKGQLSEDAAGNLQVQINKLEKQLDIHAGGSWSGVNGSSIDITGNAMEKCPLTRAISSFGSGFEIFDGGIKVENAGSYMIAGSVYINAAIGTELGIAAAYIKNQNGDELNSAMEVGDFSKGSFTGGVSVAPKIVTLSKGDILYLYGRIVKTTGKMYAGNSATYLTIMRVA